MTKNKDPIDVVELLKKWRYFLILWAVLSAFFIWALDTTSGGIIAEMYALGGVYGWYIIDSILIGLIAGVEWAGVIWGAHDRYRRRPSAFLVNVLFYEVLVGVIFGVFLGM